MNMKYKNCFISAQAAGKVLNCSQGLTSAKNNNSTVSKHDVRFNKLLRLHKMFYNFHKYRQASIVHSTTVILCFCWEQLMLTTVMISFDERSVSTVGSWRHWWLICVVRTETAVYFAMWNNETLQLMCCLSTLRKNLESHIPTRRKNRRTHSLRVEPF